MKDNLKITENTTQQGISNKYALCIVDVKNLGARTFSYIIPQHLKSEIKIGQAVLVPFGHRKNNIIAFVAGFSNYLEENIKAKAKEIEFVDEYRGNQIPEGKKSITLKVKILNEGTTMTSEQINEKMNSILKVLDKKCRAKLREE